MSSRSLCLPQEAKSHKLSLSLPDKRSELAWSCQGLWTADGRTPPGQECSNGISLCFAVVLWRFLTPSLGELLLIQMDSNVLDRVRDSLQEFLTSKGLRRTVQREAIIDAAFGTNEHSPAEDLLVLAGRMVRPVSRAAVSRPLPFRVRCG